MNSQTARKLVSIANIGCIFWIMVGKPLGMDTEILQQLMLMIWALAGALWWTGFFDEENSKAQENDTTVPHS